MFTKPPIQQTLDIVRKRLCEDPTLHRRTKLSVENIVELTQFITTTTYFSFREVIYIQKFGTAMGSPVSPVLANLFMDWLQKMAIATAPEALKPKLCRRRIGNY